MNAPVESPPQRPEPGHPQCRAPIDGEVAPGRVWRDLSAVFDPATAHEEIARTCPPAGSGHRCRRGGRRRALCRRRHGAP
ncbi:hypothetical protein ACU4GD_06050 [Cupriavidus basilensis]